MKKENIVYDQVTWSDIPRLYAYVLAATAAEYDAKNREERMEAKDIAEREISSILLDSSFIAEYSCQKANIKSKTLADFSKAVIANDFQSVDNVSLIDRAMSQSNSLLQETLERMASLNRTFDRYSDYFGENRVAFTIYNESNKKYVGKSGTKYDIDSYVPIDEIKKDEEGNYILDGFDVSGMEAELKENFVQSYLDSNLEDVIAKLEEDSKTIERYMRHNVSMEKVEDGQKTYAMNGFPRTIEDKGREIFLQEHQNDESNALIGKNFDTGEKFPTTRVVSKQINEYINFCKDISSVSAEVGMSMLASEDSVIGNGMRHSKSHKFFADMQADDGLGF